MYADAAKVVIDALQGIGYIESKAAVVSKDIPAGRRGDRTFTVMPGSSDMEIDNPRRMTGSIVARLYYQTSLSKGIGGTMVAEYADEMVAASYALLSSIRSGSAATSGVVWQKMSVSVTTIREGDWDYIMGTITAPVMFTIGKSE